MNKESLMQTKHSNEEKLKAAYALNMCTVSVSQIVDYNDLYVLEQEYDAILNNLNLKQMPKDEALLRIISELLNTITFFRIQEIKKSQIEKKYKQKLKNAIWSAVPSLSVVVSGNPVAIALSLATQIGSGYMNYRREKANIASDKEDAESELQITAIEQLNALRRELFTTAWRLADEYDFNDEWRLTEKQIKQYNEILLDTDEYRKYARLEAISNKFEAYPPFWYFYGHTANYIAEMARDEMNKNLQQTDDEREKYYELAAVAKTYSELAKSHYEQYFSLCANNILREDQLTATFALEYVDLLWSEDKPNLEKIGTLLKLAENMAPNSLDILQLCSISYLKIGSTDNAIRLLKILVNEDYNAIANAKLLSRLYVSKYIDDKDSLALSNYKILERQIDPLYLYPMPKGVVGKEEEYALESNFMAKQKAILKKAYRNSIDSYAKKNIIEFNSVLPSGKNDLVDRNSYFGYTEAAKKQRMDDVRSVFANTRSANNYLEALKERGLRYGYIRILNQTISGLESLSCFKNLKTHDALIKIVEGKIRNAKSKLSDIQEKIDGGSFSFDDYCLLVNSYSYQYFTEDFLEKLKKKVCDNIDSISDMSELDTYEMELYNFCTQHNLPSPDEYLHTFKANDRFIIDDSEQIYFGGELIGVDGSDYDYSKCSKEMLKTIKDNVDSIVSNPECVTISLVGDSDFDIYFQNNNIKVLSGSLYLCKQKALAIIDDKTKKDFDLILCVDGITPVAKNVIRDTVNYSTVVYSANGNKSELMLGYPDVYSNKNVNIIALKGLVDKLSECLQNNK